MKISYEGHDYEFDLLKVPVEELREVKRKLNLTVRQFLTGVTEADVDAILALKWCVLRSGGQHDDLLLNPRDPFPDYWDFLAAWNAADEAKEAEPEDPTGAGSLPATPTPESSGSSAPTSTSSPVSTAFPSPFTAEYANGRSDGSPSELSSPTSPA